MGENLTDTELDKLETTLESFLHTQNNRNVSISNENYDRKVAISITGELSFGDELVYLSERDILDIWIVDSSANADGSANTIITAVVPTDFYEKV